MTRKQKLIPVVLLVLFSFYSVVPSAFSGLSTQPEASGSFGIDQTAGTPIPTKPALMESEPPPILAQSEETVSSPISDSSAFLSESPLSPVTEEEENVEAAAKTKAGNSSENTLGKIGNDFDLRLSDDPFYGTSGSWGQAYDDLYWLKRVRADEAWSISRGTGVSVAVIDTGLDFDHPDISTNIWSNTGEIAGNGIDDDGNGYVDDVHGWDFVNWDNDPRDDNGHGTHVAGIVGAVKDNAVGIAGIAPVSKILPIKVLDKSGSGLISNVITAIRYAADLGAKVINMSLGVAKNLLPKWLQRSFENAVKYAVAKGSVVVAAAGNEASNVQNSYPAGIRDVIAVGAIEPVTDKRAWFSNFGSSLDFTAPGVDVLSLRAGGTTFGSDSGTAGYSRASGTSMASPVVAGVVALLRSWNPLLTFSEIYDRLKRSATDLGKTGFDNEYGYGLVNAYGALTVPAITSLGATALAAQFFTKDDGRKNLRAVSARFGDSNSSPALIPASRIASRLPVYDLRLQRNHFWHSQESVLKSGEPEHDFLKRDRALIAADDELPSF